MDKGKQIVSNSKLERNYLKRILSKRKDDEDFKIANKIDLDEQIERFR